MCGMEELAARCSKWREPEPTMKGGYQQLYLDRVMQADKVRISIFWSHAAEPRFPESRTRASSVTCGSG